MGGGLAAIAVSAHSKFIDPHIAAHMDVDGFSCNSFALCRYKLVNDATLQDKWSIALSYTIQILILQL